MTKYVVGQEISPNHLSSILPDAFRPGSAWIARERAALLLSTQLKSCPIAPSIAAVAPAASAPTPADLASFLSFSPFCVLLVLSATSSVASPEPFRA